MDKVTWEFDGRCPKCGSEELTEIIDYETTIIECECGYSFMPVISIDDALFY
jgi:uncharacterized Zn finger protein